MTSRLSDHDRQRLNLASTREFSQRGAGQRRRERLSQFGDEFLTELYNDAVGKFENAAPGRTALAAVGSQGRRDVGPLSDYDLVFLHEASGSKRARISEFADLLWYPLWDAGVRFDHSVRTPSECRAAADEDLTATMGLLDLRVIAGDPGLVSTARENVLADWRGAARKRLPELLASATSRRERFGEIITSQAPNLKDSAGGLRDLVLIRALTTAWLVDPKRDRLETAEGLLLDVRDALHVVTGRSRNVLALQEQDAVAALLGYSETDQLLRDVMDAARTVEFTTASALRGAQQVGDARRLKVGPRRPRLHPLEYGVLEHDGEVVMDRNAKRDLALLFRVATVAARRQLSLSPKTIDNFVTALADEFGDGPVQFSRQAREAFVDLLATGPGLINVWEALDRAGVWVRLMPQWAAIRSRLQRNTVHTYTVDRHSVETVVRAGEYRDRLSRPDVLLLAALFHDVGKTAQAHDHSAEGAPVAAAILTQWGFPSEVVSDVRRLVAQHLTLVDLATRRDPEDPATLLALLDAVDRRVEILEQLTALTEADARATGPAAWSSWRAQLVSYLAGSAKAALSRDAASEAAPRAGSVGACSASTASPGDSLPEVASASVEVSTFEWGWRVVMAAPDRRGLFPDMVAVLGRLGSSIRRASVTTTGRTAHATFDLIGSGMARPDAEQLRALLDSPSLMEKAAASAGEATKASVNPGGNSPDSKLPGAKQPPVAPSPNLPGARALIQPDASATATVVEVRAGDRLGLLRDLARALVDVGVEVRSAHIATIAAQTSDTFYVTERDGSVLSGARAAQLISALIDAADGR